MKDITNRIQELAQEYHVPASLIYLALAMVTLASALALVNLFHSATRQELQSTHQAVFNQADTMPPPITVARYAKTVPAEAALMSLYDVLSSQSTDATRWYLCSTKDAMYLLTGYDEAGLVVPLTGEITKAEEGGWQMTFPAPAGHLCKQGSGDLVYGWWTHTYLATIAATTSPIPSPTHE